MSRPKYPEFVRRKIDALQDNIRKYERRDKIGTLSEKGQMTLAVWKQELAELKSKYK